jgi:hypothetical protein
MAEVVLIPTGKLEHTALHLALGRLFPEHTFAPRPPDRHLDGFTSTDVARIPAERPEGHVLDELVAALVAAVAPGRKGQPADYAFVLEDLELVNDHQPDRVVAVFRAAVARHVGRFFPSARAQEKACELIRERCSFHLFRPMMEAYFFGEPAALERAGTSQVSQLAQPVDLERFLTIDQPFLLLPDGVHEQITDMPERQRHPKSYLHYLCDSTLANRQKRYRETKGGVRALRDLDWQQVLSEAPHCPFLHAFLDDLTDALECPLSFIDRTHAAPETRFPGGSDRLLRNI